MTDKLGAGDVVRAVKGVIESVPVYQDALQPAAKSFGHEAAPAGKELATAVVTLSKAINVALAPLEVLVWGYDQVKKNFLPALAEKLKKTQQIITPPLNVAGPTIEALKFSGSNPVLREMFVKLLATSMDANTTLNAHPAFVDIVRHLTPDEARILAWFVPQKGQLFEYKWPDRGTQNRSFVDMLLQGVAVPASCEHTGLIASYLDNLTRLGLLKHVEDEVADDNWQTSVIGSWSINYLGGQFCKACLE